MTITHRTVGPVVVLELTGILGAGTDAEVARAGGRMVLANLTQRVRSVIAIAKLVTVFDVYDTKDEAIAAVAGVAPMST